MADNPKSQEPNKVVVAIFSIIVVLLTLRYIGKIRLGTDETPPDPPKIDGIEITKEELEQQTLSPEMKDFQNLQKNGHTVVLNKENIVTPKFVIGDQEGSNQTAKDFLLQNSLRLEAKGNIERGYLHIRVAAGYPPASLSKKESVYLYLDSGDLGGHLYKPASFITEPNAAGETEYLFKLENISFTTLPYSDGNAPYTRNWLSTLQKKGVHYLGGFVSANRYAVIQEISFIYAGDSNAIVVK